MPSYCCWLPRLLLPRLLLLPLIVRLRWIQLDPNQHMLCSVRTRQPLAMCIDQVRRFRHGPPPACCSPPPRPRAGATRPRGVCAHGGARHSGSGARLASCAGRAASPAPLLRADAQCLVWRRRRFHRAAASPRHPALSCLSRHPTRRERIRCFCLRALAVCARSALRRGRPRQPALGGAGCVGGLPAGALAGRRNRAPR